MMIALNWMMLSQRGDDYRIVSMDTRHSCSEIDAIVVFPLGAVSMDKTNDSGDEVT